MYYRRRWICIYTTNVVLLLIVTSITIYKMKRKIAFQGAEARVYESKILGKKCIAKERFSKQYRHAILDTQLRKQRTVHEARVLARCRASGILAPAVYFVDDLTQTIYMEFIEGKTVKDVWDEQNLKSSNSNSSSDNNNNNNIMLTKINIAEKIGIVLAKIHNHDMVHGDPTTSNIMLRNQDNEIVLIDFGLGSQNASIDDKAVDLYVLERAMLATHPNTEDLFKQILKSYGEESKKAKMILGKFESVRARGRKRMAFG